jgi:hypothetical protein
MTGDGSGLASSPGPQEVADNTVLSCGSPRFVRCRQGDYETPTSDVEAANP